MMSNTMYPVITIDGPSGSGKGTLSRNLAKILRWNLLDSGIMYRLLAIEAIKNKIDINHVSENKLIELILKNKVNFLNQTRTLCLSFCQHRIQKNIYTEIVGNFASKIAVFPKVRRALLPLQRMYCIEPGLIADGRDMGTVVFPNAILKVFLFASYEERKKRRFQKYFKNVYYGIGINNYSSVLSLIQERDNRDYNRNIAPVIPASNSLMLDSTYLSINDVQSKVLMHIKEVLVLSKTVVYNKKSFRIYINVFFMP